MNILIAVPSMDSVPAAFAQSLAMLEKVGNCAIAFQVGSLVYNSRNKLATKALEMGADFVFWLDSDMVFESDTLKRLMSVLEAHDLDIVTGLYYRRVPPYKPVAFKELRVEGNDCIHSDFESIPGGLFEMEGCGFGCVLMKSDVLFDVIAKFQDAFSPINGIGEDLSFCIRARECGYKIICDPSIPLGHCSHSIVTKQFFEAYNQSLKGQKND